MTLTAWISRQFRGFKIGFRRGLGRNLRKRWKHFLRGVGSVMNLFPVVELEPIDDAEAIRSDWEAVGEDLRWAMEKCEKEQDDSQNKRR